MFDKIIQPFCLHESASLINSNHKIQDFSVNCEKKI